MDSSLLVIVHVGYARVTFLLLLCTYGLALNMQNLLLSTSDETAVLKIGDFGFARWEIDLAYHSILIWQLGLLFSLCQSVQWLNRSNLWDSNPIYVLHRIWIAHAKFSHRIIRYPNHGLKYRTVPVGMGEKFCSVHR